MNGILQTVTLGFVFAIGASTVAAAADKADPVIGTWTLDSTASKYHADAPKSMTRVYSAGAAGTDMKVTGVAADGTAISQAATLTYDGKDCAVTGVATYDTMSLTKVNGSTVKSELKKGGKVVGHTTRTISGKGTVLTLASAWKTAKGGTTHDLAIFKKQ